MKAGTLDRRIRIERRIALADPVYGTAQDAWELVAEVPASVVDALPSRGERIADGINVAARPARVRIRFREDVTSAMRVMVGRNLRHDDGEVEWNTDRLTQIITIPAEMGRREGLEFIVEDISTRGDEA